MELKQTKVVFVLLVYNGMQYKKDVPGTAVISTFQPAHPLLIPVTVHVLLVLTGILPYLNAK